MTRAMPNRLRARPSPCGAWAVRDGSPPSPSKRTAAWSSRWPASPVSPSARTCRATSRSASPAPISAPYAKDFVGGYGENDVDRPRLIATLRSYLVANNLNADWERINSASNERLVNTLSILSPYGPEEKQALLEAPDLRSRAEVLVALAEMELAATDDGSGTSLQ